jgi:hypothetical protein
MNHAHRHWPRLAAVAIVALLVTGCGGGGGGGGGSAIPNPAPPPTPPPPPPVSPSDPAANYTGRTSVGAVTEATAAALADASWYGLELVLSLTGELIDPSAPPTPGSRIDRTVQGAQGGTARITGTIDSFGLGTLTIDYAAFREDGVTIGGREVQQILTRIDSSAGAVRRTFENVQFDAPGLTVRLVGSLTRTDGLGPGGREQALTGDLLLVDRASGEQRRLADLALRRARTAGATVDLTFELLSGTARVFDGAQGQFDLRIEPALRFTIDPAAVAGVRPAGGGSLALAGGSTRVWTTPLSRDHVALELDAAGRGVPTRSLAYRWADAFDRPAGASGSPAIAISGPDLEEADVVVGREVRPHALFSEQGNGRWLEHRWELVGAPAGSAAALADSDSVRPRFTPDVPGRYLLRVRVVDGGTTSVDHQSFDAGTIAEPERIRPYAVFAPPVSSGAELVLDASRSYVNTGRVAVRQRWRVETRGSTAAAFTDPSSQVRVPVSAGAVYDVQFEYAPDGNSWLPARFGVATAPNVALLPSIPLGDGRRSGPVRALDADGNGTTDVLHHRIGLSGHELVAYSGRGGPRFAAATPPVAGGTTGPFVTVDPDGDRRVDAIVARGGGGLGILRQTAPLQFAPLAPLPRVPTCELGLGPIWVTEADVTGDGRADLLAPDPCSAGTALTEYYEADPSAPTGYRAAAPLPVDRPLRATAGRAADLDGDGVPELVAIEATQAVPARVLFVRLQRPTATVYADLPMSPGSQAVRGHVSFGDLNGDRRSDVVVTTGSGLRTFLQSAPGQWSVGTDLPPPRNGFADVSLRDLDGDGRTDVVLDGEWFRQQADGTFQQFAFVQGGASALADLDGDGRLDLVDESGALTLRAP